MAETKRKRRVKNPETFRERAVKATAETDKPSKRGVVKRAGGRLITPVARPVGRASKTVFSRGPLRLLRRPARLLGLLIFPPYFRKSWQELRLVSWPNWSESRRLTFAVLIFAVIFGAVIAGVDYGLDKIFRNVLLK